VQACLNETLQCGDTINIPAGSSTWTTQVTTGALPTGCSANQGITISGATVCTGGCSPGSSGSGLTFTDNTNITLSDTSGSFLIGQGETAASNTSFVRVTGISFINGGAASHGQVEMQGTHNSVSGRFDHVHFTDSTGDGGVMLTVNDGPFLIDHVRWDETASSGETTPINFGGDFPSGGTLNWQDATNFGSNQSSIVEDSYATATNGGSTEGFFDSYYGAKLTIRHSIINNMSLGGGHGSDTAYWRSMVLGEFYNLTINCDGSVNGYIMNNRGGTMLFYDNTVTGTCAAGVYLQYLRYGAQNPNAAQWGIAGANLNWTWTSANGAGLAPLTLNTSTYQTTHTYVAGSAANMGANCSLYSSAGGTTGSSAPSCPGFDDNVTDSGGVVWKNVGGTTTAGGGGSGWCSANPDTTCTANSACNALSSGDTCSRYADAPGGTYPFRDQPCVGHNQVVMPCYEWGNSGPGLASPVYSVDTANTAMIQSKRDYYDTTAMPGYTAYTYPDPLQGGAPVPPQNLQAAPQ
jgi:hypothetical protein